MPKSKSKRFRCKTKSQGNPKPEIPVTRNDLNDRYISKIKDYFCFCESMFYNKEILNWHYQIGVKKCDEITNSTNALNVSNDQFSDWKSFIYHKLIGQGSYGKVFIASWDNKTLPSSIPIPISRMCLVKLVGFRLGGNLQRHYLHLINERDSLIRLGGVWTPKLYSCFIDPQLAAVFVQEYIDGVTMSHVKKIIWSENNIDLYPILLKSLRSSKYIGLIPPLNERQFEIIKFYMGELLAAVKFIHDHGILHRDLKENNILLTHKGHLKLIDFGLSERQCCCKNVNANSSGCFTSHLLNPYISSTFRLWGNRYYAAPEYITNTNLSFDDRGDYWAVGVIFFHLLFGCRPYKHIVSNKVVELTNSIGNWQTESFLNKSVIEQRCRYHKSMSEAFFKLICPFENRLCDLDYDMPTKQWQPNTWDLFKELDLVHLYEYQAPLKIPCTKSTYNTKIQLEHDLIKGCFTEDKYMEHLDCPYFHFMNAKSNDFFKDLKVQN